MIQDYQTNMVYIAHGLSHYVPVCRNLLEALHRDQEHRVETVVTKEDGHLVVFFYRDHKSVSNGMPEGEGTVYYPGAGKKVKVD